MKIKVTDEQFAHAYNDQATYPSLMHVAAGLRLSYQTVRNRASEMRHAFEAGLSAIELIDRKVVTTHTTRRDQMIEEAVVVAGSTPNGNLARTRYFEETQRDTRAVLPEFGNLPELKRQAGLAQTRDEERLARQVARHASLDHLRPFSEERKGYSEKYVRDNPGRFKTILGCNDLHDKEIDPFWLRVFIDTAKRLQPDVVTYNGDIFDLPEFGKYNVDPRDWDLTGRIKFVHERIFKPVREAAPNAQNDLIEGNHEHRLVRHLGDCSPATMEILGDLHKMTVGQLLGLDRFEINYIAKGELTAYHSQDAKREISKNYRIYWNTVLANHFPDAVRLAMPGWNGHHHSHKVQQLFNPMFGAYEWHQFGCGHQRHASYTQGEKWGLGFGIWHVDTVTRSTVCEYVPITDFAIVGGKYYYRTPEETYSDPSILVAGQ